MMDYSSNHLNLDLHHQEDFHGSSSSFPLPWNHHDLLLSTSNGAALPSSSSRDHLMMPMVQDLGFQWAPATGHGGESYNYMMNMSMSNMGNVIKGDQTISESFAKLTGINLQDYSLQMPPQELHQTQLGFGPMDSGGGNIVSGTGLQGLYPGPMGMDLQAMDLLASSRFGRTMPQPSLDTVALLRDDLGYGHLGQLQEANHQAPPSSTSYHKASHSVSGVTEAKRSNSLDSSRTSQPAAPPAKKPRFESRSSFTPFKVRKEKLGDRIAALQQLVAPFGKTDTASVLMEAIGYIKFLQDQVETLSVPYMRSSNNKKARTSQGATSEERSDEPKPDLRSRGLCLVPLSCTSYVTNENAGVWSPPNYRGAT